MEEEWNPTGDRLQDRTPQSLDASGREDEDQG